MGSIIEVAVSEKKIWWLSSSGAVKLPFLMRPQKLGFDLLDLHIGEIRLSCRGRQIWKAFWNANVTSVRIWRFRQVLNVTDRFGAIQANSLLDNYSYRLTPNAAE